MQDESCVLADPNLVNLYLVESLLPEAKAYDVIVVEADENSALIVGSLVSGERDPADFARFEFRCGSTKEQRLFQALLVEFVRGENLDHVKLLRSRRSVCAAMTNGHRLGRPQRVWKSAGQC